MDNENKRTVAGSIYLILGLVAILLSFLLIYPEILLCLLSKIIITTALWCMGWSCLGGGAGLINTRNHPQDKLLHLIGYWGFVLLAVSIFSFVVSLYISGDNYPNLYVKFYSLSALLALIGGFLGYKFLDLVLELIKNLKLSFKK